jgi:hypothetical protein
LKKLKRACLSISERRKNGKIVRAPLWLLFKSQDAECSKPERILIEALKNGVRIPGNEKGELIPCLG